MRLPFSVILLTGILTVAIVFGGYAYAQEDWKTEFEAVCAVTQDPSELSSDKLKELADRCDRLSPVIEKLDESQRKVYLKRLRMCRNLFIFIVESREKK
ncbi:MAG: hypothetical protein C4526_06480 [Nitrospiraceae bacterium]|nr:MAG: hypothetical protein C4526_06480 [Nitrospiraceae bacterium]